MVAIINKDEGSEESEYSILLYLLCYCTYCDVELCVELGAHEWVLIGCVSYESWNWLNRFLYVF